MRKRRKRKKWWIPIIILLAFAAGIFFYGKKYFRIKEINISGSDKYTYEELYNYIFKDRNDKNMILFKYTDKKAPKPEIPFIAKTVIDIKWPSTINITVYEKSIIGYVYYYGHFTFVPIAVCSLSSYRMRCLGRNRRYGIHVELFDLWVVA